MIKKLKAAVYSLSCLFMASTLHGQDVHPSALPFALGVATTVVEEGQPVLISPLSLFRTMSILALGAEGETRHELLTFIGMDKKANTFIPYLVRQTDVLHPEVRLATGIFTSPFITLRKDFPEKMQVFCPETTLATIDFQKDPTGSASFINNWVSKATEGKIENLLQPQDIKPDTVCAVIDALYFKASWKDQFDPEATSPDVFHAPSFDKTVSMMHRVGKMQFFQDDTLSYVELPYEPQGKGSFVLELLMGASGASDDVARTFEKVRKSAMSGRVALGVPKMELHERNNLTDTLKKLGLKESFSNRAQFLGISYTPMALQEVIQEAYLKVHEEGSEGAAATAATMRMTSSFDPNRAEIVFDQPFWLVLREKNTDSILFFAYVTSP